jgi:hypothetical protein
MTPPFLTLALDGRDLPALRFGCFIPEETIPDAHWIGDWVGPGALLDVVKKKKSLSSAEY